jgi:hypothetical protein
MKIRLAVQVLYTTSSGLIKLSILFLYRRIFPNLRMWTTISIAIIVALSIAFICAAIFQCKPVGRLWGPSDQGGISCIATLAFWCDVAVVYLVTNIWVVCLPLKSIYGQLSHQEPNKDLQYH